MPTVQIADRAVIRVAGPEAESFLQNILTPDLTVLGTDEARPGALLTPQGKILFDFLISRTGSDGFLLECSSETAQDFLKRLMLYKLRAKADVSLQEQEPVLVSWESDSASSHTDSGGIRDCRFPETVNVRRHQGGEMQAEASLEDWERLRIAHGVAESGSDYALGEAFPHDVLLDQNGGVGLRKGCYVGQEVVSRMHHRGTARRRLVIVRGEDPLPAPGGELTAEGRPLGKLGTVQGADGLAIVRIDRAAEARQAGTQVLAGTVPVTLRVPAYAGFSLDGTDESGPA
ncbi:folate-binding protein YgfZ [Chelativorans sp. M5D2P16]|uniref:CAF17-like 4Fe-4S cluster assembly/insertion protein YgfZ n=1 Tax=Chelativorans sp. M5D2P16 TaxID=3095678 RepID=UPI002AC9F645|nr:folate-binding protein YgfZ [Chelativorans sp. M5D2P16]MDZ5696253.1 folate-binding protein YgfZ [Chelativorans sp. M5D2P16]